MEIEAWHNDPDLKLKREFIIEKEKREKEEEAQRKKTIRAREQKMEAYGNVMRHEVEKNMKLIADWKRDKAKRAAEDRRRRELELKMK